MDAFTSTIKGKIDAKGRVSIPALFRQVIARQNGDTIPASDIYLLPSFYDPALEGGGAAFMRRLSSAHNDDEDIFSEHNTIDAVTHFADTHSLKYDSDGRVMLPPRLLEHAQIERELFFVGLGHRFQIWNPARYEAFRAASRERARARRERETEARMRL